MSAKHRVLQHGNMGTWGIQSPAQYRALGSWEILDWNNSPNEIGHRIKGRKSSFHRKQDPPRTHHTRVTRQGRGLDPQISANWFMLHGKYKCKVYSTDIWFPRYLPKRSHHKIPQRAHCKLWVSLFKLGKTFIVCTHRLHTWFLINLR